MPLVLLLMLNLFHWHNQLMICLLIQDTPPPPIPLSAVSRHSSLHSLPVLPPSDCRHLRFSVTADFFCTPYKLLYYYYYYSTSATVCVISTWFWLHTVAYLDWGFDILTSKCKNQIWIWTISSWVKGACFAVLRHGIHQTLLANGHTVLTWWQYFLLNVVWKS